MRARPPPPRSRRSQPNPETVPSGLPAGQVELLGPQAGTSEAEAPSSRIPGPSAIEPASVPAAAQAEPAVLAGSPGESAHRAPVPGEHVYPRPVYRRPRLGPVVLPLLLIVGSAGVWFWQRSKPSTEATSGVEEAKAKAPSAGTTTASRPGAPSTTIAPPAPKPKPEEVSRAVAAAGSLSELEALSSKFPDSAEVWVALARRHVQDKAFGEALSATQRALSLDPRVRQDGKLATVLWSAAQSDDSEAAFNLLRSMDAQGADILLDLATTTAVRQSVRDRARADVASPRFRAVAGPDAKAAAGLFLAPDCDARRSQLAQAQREGRHRTLRLLEAYEKGGGCHFAGDSTCGDCLRGSPELAEARNAIRTQLGS